MSAFLQRFIGPKPPDIPHGSKPLFQGRRPSLADTSNVMFVNAIYYPNYRVYRGETPASLNYSYISHVFYAFANVSADGFVTLSDEYADVQLEVDGMKGCLGSFMALKKAKPHLKVVISIGGGAASQNFAAVAASAALRDNFGISAKGLLTTYGFDGIDIDWEHPSDAKQGQDFLALLAAVRLYLPDAEYLLTAALPAGEWALQHIDLYKAQDYLDLINLMAYDFTGSWTPQSGHHAQLYAGSSEESSAAAAVTYLKSIGFPSKKILLGVPAYGRSFLGANGPGQNYSGHGGEEGTYEYKNLPLPDTEEVVDTVRVAAFCSGGAGGFVSYDNQETVRLKGLFCKAQQLGGLFYWTGTADAKSGDRSLIAAGFNALH